MRTSLLASQSRLSRVHFNTLADLRVGVLVSTVHVRKYLTNIGRQRRDAVDFRVSLSKPEARASVEPDIVLRMNPASVDRPVIKAGDETYQARTCLRVPSVEDIPHR